MMYEGQGQGHKISALKMKKKGIFHLFNPFLWSVAEDSNK